MGFLQIGKQIETLGDVDSTSNYVAKGLENDSIEPGQVIMAHFQTAGRGQHGRFWQSTAGENLLFSFALPVHELPKTHQFLLSKAISLAIVDYLDGLKLSDVEIKWPNDILVNRRKIAGMLLEFKTIRSSRMAMVGIGLNVNQDFTGESFKATSLKAEIGHSLEISEVLKGMLKAFNQFVPSAFDLESRLLQMAYLGRLYGKGDWINFVDKERSYQGKIQVVDDSGQLIVKSRQGYSATYQMREVKIRY